MSLEKNLILKNNENNVFNGKLETALTCLQEYCKITMPVSILSEF